MPAGVRTTDVQFRQASFIETSIDNLLRVLIEALVCVAIVLFVFLLNWQTTLISLVAIPLSVLSTARRLPFDGPVDQHHDARRPGHRHRRAGRRRGGRRREHLPAPAGCTGRLRAATGAALSRSSRRPPHEVRSGIVYATMIIVLVFLPLFALSGIEGRLFTPLGIAYIVSILASLLVSLTVTPVLCYWLLPRMRKPGRARHRPRARPEALAKGGCSNGASRGRRFVIGLPRRRRSSPRSRRGCCCRAPSCRPSTRARCWSACVLQPGHLARRIRPHRPPRRADLIAEVPEVRSVGRRTGRAELDEHAEGVHNSELDVDLKPSARSREEVLADIRARLSVLPAAHHRRPADRAPARPHAVGRARADRAQDLRRGLDTLRGLAEPTAKTRLKAIPGIVDLQIEKQVRIPQMQVRVDYAKAALYGAQPEPGDRSARDACRTAASSRRSSTAVEALRRRDAPARCRPHHARARRHADRDARPGRIPLARSPRWSRPTGPTRSSARTAGAASPCSANTDGSRHGGDRRRHPRGDRRDEASRRATSPTSRAQFQAQEEASRMIGLLSARLARC